MNKIFLTTMFTLALCISAMSQSEKIRIAKLQYGGGGDWYANKTALPNLAKFCNQELGTNIDVTDGVVQVGSPELFNYSFIYMTGHGNVVFSPSESENLRKYLTSGGFLHIDDNYGLNSYVRLEMKKVFPELEFIELPREHPIYNQKFEFPEGIPKIHEHDNKPPQGFGLIYQGKLVCYFSYESDLGNGWENQSIHNDPQEVRLKALKMGANLISYAFTEL